MSKAFTLHSLAETRQLAERLAAHITPPLMLGLCGPLGAGKTELVRGLATALGVPGESVTSPTYVLVQRYRGRIQLIHLDYYRLRSEAEAWDLGLDEWLEEPALTVIEWADKFPGTWPTNWLRCDLSLTADGARRAVFTASGPRGLACLSLL